MLKIFLGAMVGLFSATTVAQPTELILLRHLHKNTGENPSLSPCGLAQANVLQQQLANLTIDTAWHSQYQRTAQTARLVTANRTNYQTYDAKTPAETFKQTLLEQTGVQLVVGHSNTIPELIKALSGETVTIAETEFGMLYRLQWQNNHWQLQQQPLPRLPKICTSAQQPQQH
ncbi:MAG TPA: hypothetical protein DCS87_02275 [Rheinheimera sp.]|nr:hypothetical protein [Rheinheimera sp.]